MNSESQELKRRIQRGEKWMIIFTGLIAVSTISYAVIAYYQWGVMRDQLAEIRSGSSDTKTLAESAKEQTTNIEKLAIFAADQSKISRDAIEVAARSAKAAEEANKIARDALDKGDARAKEANETARNALMTAQRPWVGISEPIIIDKPLTFDSEGALVVFRVTLDNVGNSPANGAFPIADVLLGESFDEVIEKQREVCSSRAMIQYFGTIMLPGQKVTSEPINVLVNWPKIRLNKDGETFIWLVGCVRYWDQFKTLRRTAILYVFETPDGKSWLKPQGTVPGVFKPYLEGNTAN